jgi:hypothetical protein
MSGDAATHLNACGKPALLPSRSSNSSLTHGSTLRESDGVDPQLLLPPFKVAGKELGAVAAIDRQSARALGGDARADGQQWGRSTVWAPRVLPPLMAAVWRLQQHGLVVWLCSMAIAMAGSGAWTRLGAVRTAVRARRQERPAELLQFRQCGDNFDSDNFDNFDSVETRTHDRASMGVGRVGGENGRVVCGNW